MPFQKFRSFDDARRALWCDHPDEAYFRRMAALWRLSAKLNPMTFPPGVYKYRSIEEANQARGQVDKACAPFAQETAIQQVKPSLRLQGR